MTTRLWSIIIISIKTIYTSCRIRLTSFTREITLYALIWTIFIISINTIFAYWLWITTFTSLGALLTSWCILIKTRTTCYCSYTSLIFTSALYTLIISVYIITNITFCTFIFSTLCACWITCLACFIIICQIKSILTKWAISWCGTSTFDTCSVTFITSIVCFFVVTINTIRTSCRITTCFTFRQTLFACSTIIIVSVSTARAICGGIKIRFITFCTFSTRLIKESNWTNCASCWWTIKTSAITQSACWSREIISFWTAWTVCWWIWAN